MDEDKKKLASIQRGREELERGEGEAVGVNDTFFDDLRKELGLGSGRPAAHDTELRRQIEGAVREADAPAAEFRPHEGVARRWRKKRRALTSAKPSKDE